MYRFFERLARLFAVLGGMVLTLLIILTCLSIIGRSLNSLLHGDLLQNVFPDFASALLSTGIGPINGDFELVEAGLAFAIFAFMPLCQMHRAHASVDIFATRFPEMLNRALLLIIDILFALVLMLIALKLYEGLLRKQSSGETTFLLQMPVWWAYAISLLAASTAAIVGIYLAIMRILEVSTGRTILPTNDGMS